MKKSTVLYIAIFIFLSNQTSAQTWSSPKRLSWNGGMSWNTSIAASSNVVHVAWCDETPGNNEIFYKRSTDGGVTWSGPVRLTWNSSTSWNTSIAASGNGVHVAWSNESSGNFEIFYKSSTDSGATWSGLKQITWNSGASAWPCLACSGNIVFIVWSDDTPGNYEIFCKRSFDSGVTWSGLTRLTWTAGLSDHPNLTASGIGIQVVWHDDSPGNREIYMKSSTDSGANWTAPTRLTWNTGRSELPSISSIGNDINVAWQDGTPGKFEIFYRYSTDSGTSWSGLKRLTWNTGSSTLPSVHRGYGTHLVWADDSTGNREIFYKYSSNNGATWSGPTRLTWNSGDSYYPTIAEDSIPGNGFHIAWSDDTPGNREIFYKNRK